MARHLKSIVKNRLKSAISYYTPNSDISASHRRGVRYFVPIVGIDMLWGAWSTAKEALHYNKHIIIRRVPRHGGTLLQLYTYHFPKTWSAACVANRNLIKTAQKLAHALEHDHSFAAMEWRIRFFRHYFHVVKGGAKPEPGLKPYSHFYQYTYVSIYRELQSARLTASVADRAQQKALEPQPVEETISFDPIAAPVTPVIRRPVIRRAFNRFTVLQPTDPILITVEYTPPN